MKKHERALQDLRDWVTKEGGGLQIIFAGVHVSFVDGMSIIQAEWKYKYIWIHKVLITWGCGLFVGYYPDYENCKWWIGD